MTFFIMYMDAANLLRREGRGILGGPTFSSVNLICTLKEK